MPDISLFVEDHGHQEFLDALLKRLAEEFHVAVNLEWKSARRGHGRVIRELKQYFRDLLRNREKLPDLVIVATDANCKGLHERVKEVEEVSGRTGLRVICVIPAPHIERWLLLDSAAFKTVFGRGCPPPDQKCEKDRYKKQLVDAIIEAGIQPGFGGIEYTDEIVAAMDLRRIASADPSFNKMLTELTAVFRGWK